MSTLSATVWLLALLGVAFERGLWKLATGDALGGHVLDGSGLTSHRLSSRCPLMRQTT
jgi:hypothetical protein